jgi:hypothetical protein
MTRRALRPSPAMLVAMTSLAVATGGSALADDVVESVRKKFTSGSKIKPRSLPGNRVKKNALGGTEINESKLGKVPSARSSDSAKNATSATNAGHATSADNATNATHATNADNATNAINASAVNGVTEAAFTVGRSVVAACNPSSSTFVDCAAVTFTFPRVGRALVIANTSWYSNSAGATRGTCQVTVDGNDASGSVFPGQVTNNTDSTHEESIGINLVTGALTASSHTLALRCNELQNDIVFGESHISAVMIGSA